MKLIDEWERIDPDSGWIKTNHPKEIYWWAEHKPFIIGIAKILKKEK